MKVSYWKSFGLLLFLVACSVQGAEWSGNVAAEFRGYPNSPAWAGQKGNDFTLSFQPEFRHQWDDGDIGFTFIPFFRIGSVDEERNHADIRELKFLWVKDAWEILFGIDRVFWGVTESQHLVDIINQTDGVENFDGEEKLGQPMLRVTRVIGNGAVDFFLMPYFRERTFPGVEGRLRPPLVVDVDNPLYESDDEERHVDWAVRWNQSIENIDFAFSWFQGTARTPRLLRLNPTATMLTPYYPLTRQLGLEFQYTGEAWLWKLEAVHRDEVEQNYWAAVGGFEYTFVNIAESALDLGVLSEYHYDSRGVKDVVPDPYPPMFQNDIFAGARLTFNDVQSTELLAGLFVDLDDQSRSFRIEASRRIGDDFKLTLEGQAFTNVDPGNPMISFEKDDFVLVELARYF